MNELNPSDSLNFTVNYKYIIKEKIYENPGISAFYKAIDTVENRTVGIKVLHVEPKDYSKVKNEAAIINKVFAKGGNVPAIYFTNYDAKQKQFIIIMQFLEGMETLDEYFKRTYAPKPYQKLNVFKNIIETLKDIHEEGIQHRDLKPQNIMIHKDKTKTYIIDFNLSVTQVHDIEGTYNYCAPEQQGITKYPTIQQADVFSIGVMMYEVFTKKLPILGIDYYPDFSYEKYEKFTEPKEIDPSIPDKLNQFIVKCMALNPKDRFANAKEMYRVIKSIRV